MNYLDFDLEIGQGSGERYSVSARSQTGEAHSTMHFPFDEATLKDRLKDLQIALLRSASSRRQVVSVEEQSVRDFGQSLFDALIAGDVRSNYYVSKGYADQHSMNLRLRLHIQASELAVLPWEFLYDSRQGEYVCLSRNTPIVRYLDLPQSFSPLKVAPSLRILAMIASPSDQDELDIEHEKSLVQNALNNLIAKGQVELTWLKGQTWRDLQEAIWGGPWHIFHFIGHGGFNSRRDEGVIALANEAGETQLLTATQLGRLLTGHSTLRLALLNACEGARGSERDIFSSTAATLARRGVPAVVAMQYEITDLAAIEFARTFYSALVTGMTVDAAMVEARLAISMGLPNTVEWGTPVLYMRSPDGVLFDLIQEPNPRQKQVERPDSVSPSANDYPPAAHPLFPQSSYPSEDSEISAKDFFISYNSNDRSWAEWIAWQLEGAGYTTVLQTWDFLPGSNFVLDMHKAMQQSKRTIAILSPNYLQANFTPPEWASAFKQDPQGEQGILLPVRVQECEIRGLLGPIVYIDFLGLDEQRAREALLAGILTGRNKPTSPPIFPKKIRHVSGEQPTYPGQQLKSEQQPDSSLKTDRIGKQLGNYRLVRLLTQSIATEIYLGEHIYLDTQAAIKVLRTQLAGTDVARFRIEARAIARLRHPNIVRILDIGVEGDTPFWVMDYAPNGSMGERYPKGVPITPITILPYIKQIAAALQFAHDEKIIHRNIKPNNMLLGQHNEILLSDFSTAIMAEDTLLQSLQRRSDTIAYKAPEQLQGWLSPASDQYALGIVLYEWLSGDLPFRGTFNEIYGQHLYLLPPSLCEKFLTITPDVEQVVLKALAKDPEQRFASMQEFANTLEKAIQEESLFKATSQTKDDIWRKKLTSDKIAPLSQSAIAPTEDIWGSLFFDDGQGIYLAGEQVVVGRSDDDLDGIKPEVDLVSRREADTVSRIHASIEHIGSGFTLTDLNSTYGTRVNGNRLEPDKTMPIKDGDTLQFGNVTCKFREISLIEEAMHGS